MLQFIGSIAMFVGVFGVFQLFWPVELSGVAWQTGLKSVTVYYLTYAGTMAIIISGLYAVFREKQMSPNADLLDRIKTANLASKLGPMGAPFIASGIVVLLRGNIEFLPSLTYLELLARFGTFAAITLLLIIARE